MKVYDRSAVSGFFAVKEDAVPLIETTREIYMDDLLEINGHLYTVGMKSYGDNYIVVEELKVKKLPDEPEEQFYNDEITCPYCESTIESFEMPDEDDDYECPYCHSHLSYQRVVNVTYDSQPISKAKAIRIG